MQENIISVKCFIDNFYYNSTSYSEVIVINQAKDQTEDKLNTLFYFANKQGIIRKEILSNNQIWNLARSKIEQ